MTVVAAVLLVLAGFSESVGRMVPLVARRHHASRATVVRLLIAGTVVQTAVFRAWPLVAWTFAGLIRPVAGPGFADAPGWTAGAVVPLLFCAVFAFPLLGPALHVAVLVLAGLALSEQLSTTGTGWWPAAACVAVAGGALALLLAGVRAVVGAWGAVPEPAR